MVRPSFKVTYTIKTTVAAVPHVYTEYAFENGLRKLLARLKKEGATDVKTERINLRSKEKATT